MMSLGQRPLLYLEIIKHAPSMFRMVSQFSIIELAHCCAAFMRDYPFSPTTMLVVIMGSCILVSQATVPPIPHPIHRM